MQENDVFLAFPLAGKLRNMTTKLVTLRDFIYIYKCILQRYTLS